MHYLTWLKQRLQQTSGRDVINLAASGVHVASADEWLKRRLAEEGPALIERWHAGSHMFGLDALKQRIRAAFGVPAEREILPTWGASDAVRLVSEMLLAGRANAEFLIETPYYEPLVTIPRRLGARPVFVERWPGGDFAQGIADALATAPNVIALFVSNPHNPTGDWLDAAAIARLAAVLRERAPHAWLVIDETFGDLSPTPGVSHGSIDPRIITLSSLTKAHGFADLRCGWITIDRRAYPDALADWVLFENIGSKLLESLSAAAFEQIDRWRADSQTHVAHNRRLFAAWLAEMNARGLLVGDMPPHGCIAFPRVSQSADSEPVVRRLYEQHGVLVVPGAYLGPQWSAHIRIGFGGPSDTLNLGLARLAAGLAPSTSIRAPLLDGGQTN